MARAFCTWRGSAYTVVACSPRASWTPRWSKIVPRPAGIGTTSRCWRAAMRLSGPARTTWSQTTRANVTPKARMKKTRRRRSRRLIRLPATASVPAQIDVHSLIGLRRHEAERVVRHVLDPAGRRGTREVRRKQCIVRTELRALAAQAVQAEVEPQDGNVHRHDSGQQRGHDHDPHHTV